MCAFIIYQYFFGVCVLQWGLNGFKWALIVFTYLIFVGFSVLSGF